DHDWDLRLPKRRGILERPGKLEATADAPRWSDVVVKNPGRHLDGLRGGDGVLFWNHPARAAQHPDIAGRPHGIVSDDARPDLQERRETGAESGKAPV